MATDRNLFRLFGSPVTVVGLALVLALVPATSGLATAASQSPTTMADAGERFGMIEDLDGSSVGPLDSPVLRDRPSSDDDRQGELDAWAEDQGIDLAELRSDVASGPSPVAGTAGGPLDGGVVGLVDQVIVVDDDRQQCPDADARFIQTGIQLADPGATVAVCPGTYEESVTVDVEGLTLRAVQAAGLPQLLPSAASGEVILQGDGLEDQHGDIGFAIETRGVTIDGFRIQGHEDAGIVGDGLYGVMKAHIVNNTVVDNPWGFISIADTISSRETPGTALLEGNTFEDNLVGMDLRFDNHLTLRNNSLVDNTLNLWAKGPQTIDTSNTVNGRPIYYLVGASGVTIDGNEPGTDPGYVGLVNSVDVTVQNLELSNHGQAVLVHGGSGVQIHNVSVHTAFEGIEIETHVNLTVADVAVENATNGIDLYLADRSTVTNADLRDVGLGVDVVGSRASITDTTVETSTFAGVLAIGNDIRVTDSTFLDQGGDSVWFMGTDDGLIENNTMEGRGASSSWYGAIVSPSPGGDQPSRVTIKNNEVSHHRIGAFSLSALGTTMRSNTVTDSAAGFVSSYSSRDRIVDNHVRDSRFGAIGWGQTPGLTIEDNTFVHNENGTRVNSTPAGGDAIEVTGNTLENNTRRGILVGPNADGDELKIRENSIAGNGWYGIDASRVVLGTVDARDNYWGASDGPSSPTASSPLEDPVTGALADGAGDGVSEADEEDGTASVRFDPWLTEAPE